jgi:hypothetical protein
VTDNEVVWQLVTPIAETFATAPPRYGGQQPGPTPRWPFYWYSETIAALKPPVTGAETEVTVWGTGNQWQGDSFSGGTDDGFQTKATSPGGTGMMAGAFVYSITVNRISSPTGTVSVAIGCMRSGSFYSFGMYTIGQKYIVMWPIMTTDALVYQYSERVDIQAVVIARGSAGPGSACGTVSIALPDVDAPICAAHYNDTLALIGFVQ